MPVKLRPAFPPDWARLYAWRTDTAAADASEGEAPTLEQHMAWLDGALKDRSVELFVAEDHVTGGGTVGTGRLTYDAKKRRATCSVTVDPRCRGRAYATQIIAGLVHRAVAAKTDGSRGVTKLVARVRVTNTASLRAFAENQFSPARFDGDFVELERAL